LVGLQNIIESTIKAMQKIQCMPKDTLFTNAKGMDTWTYWAHGGQKALCCIT